LKSTGILSSTVQYFTARATTGIIKIGAGTPKKTTTTETDISGSFNRVVSKKE
jgi:hypothetical protein